MKLTTKMKRWVLQKKRVYTSHGILYVASIKKEIVVLAFHDLTGFKKNAISKSANIMNT